MLQLIFALNLTVSFFSLSALGFPFLAFGLWKGGFPETTTSFIHAFLAFGRGKATRFGRYPNAQCIAAFLNGMGTLLHHTTTSFIIVCASTHVFPFTRPLIAACLVPIFQHMVVMLRYQSVPVYYAITIFMEVWFEVEVIGNISPGLDGVDNFRSGSLFFDRIGRAAALNMLISHWMYLAAGSINVLRVVFATPSDIEEETSENFVKPENTIQESK